MNIKQINIASTMRMNCIFNSGMPRNISRKSKYFDDKTPFSHEITDSEEVCNDEDDDKDDMDENDQQERQKNFQVCSVCHLTVGYTESGDNELCEVKIPVLCSQNHLLCHRCVQHHTIHSATSSILCSNESHHSTSNHSGASSSSLIASDKNVTKSKVYRNHEMQLLDNNKQTRDHYSQRGFTTAEKIRTNPYIDWGTAHRADSEIKNERANDYNRIMNNKDKPTLSEMRINGEISVECSRRPIQCPRLDCAVNIAFSALTHHFLFDHPEVPILSVEPDTKSPLISSFDGLSCDSSHCLAVLLVSTKLKGAALRFFNGNQIHSKYRDRLPLPVLAARLHCANRYMTHDDINASGDGNGKSDIIIVWIAGLDITSVDALHCTIQVVDSVDGDEVRSLSYRGPINSLRTAQRPGEVLLTGDCLILHEGLLNQLTTDSATLNINVIVH